LLLLLEEDDGGLIDEEGDGVVVCADTVMTDSGEGGIMTCNNPKPNRPTKVILVLSCTPDDIFMIMSLPNLAINIIKWVKLSDASVKIWLLMVCLQSSLTHAIMPRIMNIHMSFKIRVHMITSTPHSLYSDISKRPELFLRGIIGALISCPFTIWRSHIL
jgi:hypothetical protein